MHPAGCGGTAGLPAPASEPAGRWRGVLFVATGALMSQATFLQGQTIPGIAHAVELAAPAGEGKA